MPRNQEKPCIDEIVEMLFSKGTFLGPKIADSFEFRMCLEDAEIISERLKKIGYDIRPFAFSRTLNLWTGEKYRLEATKKYIDALAEEKGIFLYQDSKAIFDGFRLLLPNITQDSMEKTQIDAWGTTLKSMIKYYERSPSAPVLELINKNPAFIEFRRGNLHELNDYDFRYAPQNIWIDKEGNPTESARETTKELIFALASKSNILLFNNNQIIASELMKVLPYLTADNFRHFPINEWETTLPAMLKKAYHNCPFDAVNDLMEKDPLFYNINRDYSLDKKNLCGHRGTLFLVENNS